MSLTRSRQLQSVQFSNYTHKVWGKWKSSTNWRGVDVRTVMETWNGPASKSAGFFATPLIWVISAITSQKSTTFWKKGELRIWMRILLSLRKATLSRLYRRLYGISAKISGTAGFANIKCLLGRNADEAQESLKTCGSRNYVAVAALDTIASNGGCYGMEPLFTDTNAITVHKTPQRLL